MAQDSKLAILRRVPLFERLGNRELERIGQLAEEVEVGLDQHLTEQGHLGDEFFVVASGHLTVLEDGRPVAQLHPGDYFGEIALLENHVRTATVRADGIAELLVIGHPEFLALMDEFPTVREAIAATAAERRGQPEPDAT
jgi:CRP/FNR family cyclic AMP-dependent transcriptional regulator